MRCEQARLNIGMLLDGELPASARDVLAAHAAGCPECSSYREDLLRIRQHLELVRERAPVALIDRVRASVEIEAATQETTVRAAPDSRRPVLREFAQWLLSGLRPHVGAVAAALLACAIAVPGTWWYAERSQTGDLVAREALGAHIRSLLQDNAVQVASLDTHTVKPWFAGRIEYTPIVKDLAAEGFQLVGGRLDYVDGRRVAALVYRRRLHQISVFIWPVATGESTVPTQTTINGYNLISWNRSGMTYWAVSDLNQGELRELEALL
jgi:anti-sigma factor RsiW